MNHYRRLRDIAIQLAERLAHSMEHYTWIASTESEFAVNLLDGRIAPALYDLQRDRVRAGMMVRFRERHEHGTPGPAVAEAMLYGDFAGEYARVWCELRDTEDRHVRGRAVLGSSRWSRLPSFLVAPPRPSDETFALFCDGRYADIRLMIARLRDRTLPQERQVALARILYLHLKEAEIEPSFPRQTHRRVVDCILGLHRQFPELRTLPRQTRS
ncbi:MAG: hypothetical protein JSS42_09505 [Proteobacteria bacterium]|nr:hypothetical protein [Pseudomonadota bacterium]